MGIRTSINNSLSSSSSSTEFELELELELDAFLDRIGGSGIVEGGITSVSRSDPVPQPISRTWILALFYLIFLLILSFRPQLYHPIRSRPRTFDPLCITSGRRWISKEKREVDRCKWMKDDTQTERPPFSEPPKPNVVSASTI
jgi:hypothetical protein